MTERSAYVTIIAKVFVSQEAIDEMVAHGHATILSDDDTEIATEEEAFKFLANEKINEVFKTDDPLKFYDSSIDFSTFQ